MPDLDRIDDPHFAGDVAAGVQPPDFATVRAGGRRRTRRRHALAAGTSALAVVAVVGGIWLGTDAGSADDPGAPAGTPNQVPSESARSPEATSSSDEHETVEQRPAWLDSDDAWLRSFAMSPDGGRTTAALWTCSRRCEGIKRVVVITAGQDDETLIRVREDGQLMAAGDDRYVFTSWKVGAQPRLFGLEGEIDLPEPKDEAPLQSGEVLATVSGSGVSVIGLMAVDPATATTHPVPTPEGVLINAATADGTALTLTATDGTPWTSDDGGTTWTRVDFDSHGMLQWHLPSALPGTRVTLLGGDGATLFPFQRIVRLLPDGSTAEHEVPGATVYALAAMVREDGQLVVATIGGEKGERPVISVGNPTEGTVAPIDPVGFDQALDVEVITTAQEPVLVAGTAERDVRLVSTDGEVWKSVRTR